MVNPLKNMNWMHFVYMGLMAGAAYEKTQTSASSSALYFTLFGLAGLLGLLSPSVIQG